MKIRRFLVVFVLLFVILSINVFSGPVFDIEIIKNLPDDLEGEPYIIGYSNYSKSIFMCVHLSNREVKSLHIGEDGVYDQSGERLVMSFRGYNSDTNKWKYYSLHDSHSIWVTEEGEKGLIPYFSNRDVYYNGEIYIFGKDYESNLGVFSGLSTSVLFSSLIKPFLKILPYVLAFIVLFIAFIKAWKYVKVVF